MRKHNTKVGRLLQTTVRCLQTHGRPLSLATPPGWPWHGLMSLCRDCLSGMLQRTPLLAAHPPLSATILSTVQGSDPFLLFFPLCYSLSNPRDGCIWGLTGSWSMLHSLEAQRAVPAWLGPLVYPGQLNFCMYLPATPGTRPQAREPSLLRLRGKLLRADGVSGIPQIFEIYSKNRFVLLCVFVYGAYVPVWGVCVYMEE